MTKLMTLSGPPALVPPELRNINISELSDFDAGLVVLKVLSSMYPGITFGELFGAKSKLSGWWTDLKNGIGDVYDGVADWYGDMGDTGSDFVRLFADEEVSGAIMDGVAAYYSGGTSTLFQSDKGKSGGGNDTFLAQLSALFSQTGEKAKQAETTIPPGILYGGIGAVGLILVLALVKK